MPLLTDWDVTVSDDDILLGQGADPQVVRARKPMLLQAAGLAHASGLGFIHPMVVMKEISVREHRHEKIHLEGGATLSGALVADHLGGAQRVVAAVCTIGAELEKEVNLKFGEDPRYAMALDGLGNACVEMLAQQVCRHVADRVEASGLTVSSPLSPGNPGWPVEIGQPQLFRILDPAQAGVSLTSGGMMLPKKSVSFVVGIGTQMAQTDECEVCSLKETCRYRHG